MKKGGKICAGLLIGGIIASGGLLVGCGSGETEEALSSTSDVYGFAGAATSMLASDQTIGGAMVSAQDASTVTGFKDMMSTAITSTLDKYMDIFDSVVGGTKPVETTVEDSTEDGYAHKMTITTNSIDGETRTIVLYFNETLTDGTDVEDTDDEERKTLLDGKLVLESGTTLYVEGVKEVEDGETEVTFSASFSETDNSNRIEFSQEHENGDEEYEFKVFLANQEVTSFSFDMEKNADGKVEVEYEQEIGGASIKFNIEKTSNNEITIVAEDFFIFNELEIKVTAVVDQNTGAVTYQYSIPQLENLVVKGPSIQF